MSAFRKRQFIPLAAVCVAAGLIWSGLNLALETTGTGPEPLAAAPEAPAAPSDPWLRGTTSEQLDQVERHLRGLDVAMIEVGYRLGELHWAGRDRNWPYAEYQLQKMELAIELALERRPKRAESTQEFLDDDVPPLRQAIFEQDPELYQKDMERLRAGCMRCHVREEVPFFTVYFPRQRQSVIRTVR
jgi:hypothetical protein